MVYMYMILYVYTLWDMDTCAVLVGCNAEFSFQRALTSLVQIIGIWTHGLDWRIIHSDYYMYTFPQSSP